MQEYTIKAGDNFHLLAQQMNCCCQDFIDVNPGLDPCQLQIGQTIKLPVIVVKEANDTGCAAMLKGNVKRCDDVIVEVEGVKFRVTRLGEASIPHEVHLILPRTEITKVEHPGGVVETSIMISNINIVNSPRLTGEGSGKEQESQTEIEQSFRR